MFSWIVGNFCFPGYRCAGVKVIMSSVVPFRRKFKSSVILSNMLLLCWSGVVEFPGEWRTRPADDDDEDSLPEHVSGL